MSDKLAQNRIIIQPVQQNPTIFYNEDDILKIYQEIDKSQK